MKSITLEEFQPENDKDYSKSVESLQKEIRKLVKNNESLMRVIRFQDSQIAELEEKELEHEQLLKEEVYKEWKERRENV